MLKRLVIVSGYFNPLHKGHLDYFEKSKLLGDELLVIVNNDIQRELKNSKFFQDEKERLRIISSLKLVNHTFLSVDKDRTVVESIKRVHSLYSKNYDIMFTNGGDQFFCESPEKEICDRLGITIRDGLGEKIQSSSWLLSNND